jgi:prepilin-type N-terminal cleavage/methylation domain-containing protein
MIKRKNGFTLLELLLVIAMGPVIIGMLAFMFQVALDTWSTQGSRIGVAVSVNKATREMARDLRNANAIASQNGNEIRFTTDGTTYYIYYLYNASDSYPSTFNKASYQLKKAALSVNMTGTFTYGSGDLIARDIVPPPTTNLSISAPIITIDLTAQQGSSVTRSVSTVKPRNI